MTNKIFAMVLPFLAFIFFAACNSRQAADDYTQYVDPFIGSDGHGHVFVGASVPFGAVQLGPSNIYKGWDWCSGYHYSDSIIIGFSHTHLSGTGCSDMGDVLIMPVTGKIFLKRGEQDNIQNSYASFYSHKNEKVRPGYYSLVLDKYNIKAELTATERVGMHRYTFPAETGENAILIDLKEGNDDESYDTYLKQIDEHTIEGYRFSNGWAADQRLYFTLTSNIALKLAVYNNDSLVNGNTITGTGVIGVLTFEPSREIILKVGISPVSCKNALANINAEAPHWNFEQVVNEAHDSWQEELSKVAIQTASEKDKRIFYTAVYHSLIAPTLFNDYNNDFRGHDKKVYSQAPFKNYTTFSLWDTYRAQNQWLVLSQPNRINDMINSMLGIYKQQGKLPIWPLTGDETNTMPGYSAVPVIADAYLKGFKGFDAEEAFSAMKSSATYEKQVGVPYVMSIGYIPCDSVQEATSIAMEYAVDDWSIAQMAKKMGKTFDYKMFAERALYYKKYFDPDLKLIRPKMADGKWRTPYSPVRSIHGVGDFTEGNGWQYSFFAPQDPEGLIALYGGDELFLEKLDSLFSVEADMGPDASADISGLIGQYAHGNEPSHHMAYLYAYAGKQWKTAEKTRYIMKEFYTDKPDGLIGNEDCGQMSAWYIFSSMGFYPVSPSGGIYVFGSPVFDKIVLQLGNNKQFTIETSNNNPENIYIQSVTLNGTAYNKSYITHEQIMAGGALHFTMGSKPNFEYGESSDNRPKSIM